MGRGRRTPCIIALSLAACLGCPAAGAAAPQGWRQRLAADTGLHLGGYFSIRFSDVEHQDPRLDLKDLSFMADWEIAPRWRLFSEIELGEALVWQGRRLTTDEAEFDLERLYVEFDLTPRLRARAGKFLTPVGRWNLIHADPLVWTVTRPLTTGVSFARHSTGLYLEGDSSLGDGELTFLAYMDDTDDLDPSPREPGIEEPHTRLFIPNTFENAVGGRLHYTSRGERIAVGTSYAFFRLQDLTEAKHLFGLDARCLCGPVELSTEFTYRLSQGGREPDEWGAFVQGVLPVWHGLHLVTRYEYFDPASTPQAAQIALVGLAWRLPRQRVLKLEYRAGANNEALQADGLLAGFAMMF